MTRRDPGRRVSVNPVQMLLRIKANEANFNRMQTLDKSARTKIETVLEYNRICISSAKTFVDFLSESAPSIIETIEQELALLRRKKMGVNKRIAAEEQESEESNDADDNDETESEDFEDADKNKKLKLIKQNKKRKLQHRDVSEGEYSAASGKNKKQKLTKRQNSDDEDDEKQGNDIVGDEEREVSFIKKGKKNSKDAIKSIEVDNQNKIMDLDRKKQKLKVNQTQDSDDEDDEEIGEEEITPKVQKKRDKSPVINIEDEKEKEENDDKSNKRTSRAARAAKKGK